MEIVKASLETFERFGIASTINNYQCSRTNPKYFINKTDSICYITHYGFLFDCLVLLRAKFVHNFVCYALARPMSKTQDRGDEISATKALIDLGIQLRLDEEECSYLDLKSEMQKVPNDNFYLYNSKELSDCAGGKYLKLRKHKNVFNRLLNSGEICKGIYTKEYPMPYDVYCKVMELVKVEQVRIGGKYEIAALNTAFKLKIDNYLVSVLFCKDKVVAFSIIDIFCKNAIVPHAVTDINFDKIGSLGSGVLINTAEMIAGLNLERFNYGSCNGDKGLISFKERHHPVCVISNKVTSLQKRITYKEFLEIFNNKEEGEEKLPDTFESIGLVA